MSKVANFLRTGPSSALLIEGWHWWLDEIRAMVPPAIGRLLADPADWLVFDVCENSLILGKMGSGGYQRLDSIDLLEAEVPVKPLVVSSQLRKPGLSLERLAIAVTANQILLRELDLPLAAPRHLRALVLHELDRCQPLPPSQIYFDCRIVDRDLSRHRMRVELAVIKRPGVDRLVAILAGWGLVPQIVGLRDQAAWTFNFLREQKRSRRQRLSSTGLLAILALFLSVGAVKSILDRHELYAQNLQATVQAAKGSAEQIEVNRHQADEIADRVGFLAERRRSGPVGPWIEALTHALPDGTWAADIERHGQSLRIRGYSKAASALIGLLDASPWFTNARFTAPLVPAGTPGVERFDLTLDLRAGGAE